MQICHISASLSPCSFPIFTRTILHSSGKSQVPEEKGIEKKEGNMAQGIKKTTRL
jgi:hypothetical protein